MTATFNWLKHYTKIFAGLGLISVVYTLIKDIIKILISPFGIGISTYIKNPDYAGKIGFIGQFQQDFIRVINAVTQDGKWPLIVFIDDLDRCTPTKSAEIIEAINLLLDSKYCIFVITVSGLTG